MRFRALSAMNQYQLLRTPGVLRRVNESGRPPLLTDDFVASLRQALERGRIVAGSITEQM